MSNSPKSIARLITDRFPARAFSMAYGSGVFKQAIGEAAPSGPKPMIDLVFAVDDPRAWHAENLERNASDYAAYFRALGSRRGGAAAAAVQERGGAEVFYHPAIHVGDGVVIKYGVISTETLAHDLDAWSTLFVAGRLHKPTSVLEEWGPREGAATRSALGFAALQRTNLARAAAVASLLLPPVFSEHELFMAIANISYAGDARFLLGAEAPGKVKSIVDGSFAGFQELYRDPIAECAPFLERAGDGELRRDASPAAVERMVLDGALPAAVRERIAPGADVAAQAAALAGLERDGALSTEVLSALGAIVRAHSFGQQLKGVASAGPGRAIAYGLAKLRKGGWSV